MVGPQGCPVYSHSGVAARCSPWPPVGGCRVLLANVVDLLAAANWQRGGDKRIKKPKPIKRPHEKDDNKQTFGAEPVAASEFEDWWDNG